MFRCMRQVCLLCSVLGVGVFSGTSPMALGQSLTNLSNFGSGQESSLLDRPSSKVVNILPISGFLIRQDVNAVQDTTTQETTTQDAVAQAEQDLPGGEVLPGLENSQELVIPQDNEPETLPDSREVIANPTSKYVIGWVGLNNRAKPKKDALEGQGRVGKDRLPSSSMSRVFRRPSPPPPVISPFQPAFVHVPVQIQVVPMYVENYHYWYDVPGMPSHYFGTPSVAPAVPPVPAPYGASSFTPPPAPSPNTFGIDRRVHVPTDQRMHYVPEVNLIGPVSNSVNFVSYPLNHHSYPAYRAYGVQFQSFPVHRRLP